MPKPALLALCLALSSTIIIAMHLPPADSPAGTIFVPPPIMQPPTLAHPDPVYDLQLRNRKLKVAFTPGDGSEQQVRELWKKPPKHPMQRTPTAEELEEIKYYLHHYQTGFAYGFDNTGILLKLPKDNCDSRYVCGKTAFYDKEGYLLYETGCCHWNASVMATKENNAAEFWIAWAIVAGLGNLAGLCFCQCCKTK
ncbi:secreted protein [Puccinia sorghi]|uniref:Secreted protein n=1 Tax=Puccinia sorghi TaxID=27349 RepID=A0A0L6UNC4_9BASI|nr:secreted protein [Puccinia sorghi]